MEVALPNGSEAEGTFRIDSYHLGEALETRVQIHKTRRKGRIVIGFGSKGDLERIVTRARVEVLWRRDGTADELEDSYAVNGFVPIPL